MANTLSKTGIVDGQVAIAGHVTQSVDAFTGEVAYDITISGSLTVTGSTDLIGNLAIPGFPDVSASLAASGVGNGFPYTGSAKITGSLELIGPYNVTASEGSNLTFEINESASFEFLTGAPNSGSFILQTSPDTGLGSLESFFGQGTAVAAAQNIPNQIFGIKYASGSGASEGELTMTVGKRDLSNLGGANQNNFYVSYEPSGIFTNAQGELEFFVGEHQNVGHGVLSVYRGGASSLTQTSSFAGYFSSSAFLNQQQYTRPFAISATSTVGNSNPAFVINKDVTSLTSSIFSVDYGGNVSSSGNISAVKYLTGDKNLMTYTEANQTLNINSSLVSLKLNGSTTASIISSSANISAITGSFSHLTGNSPITVGDQVTFQQPITASTSMTVGATNISNPRGDGFMGGGGNYDQDLVFLTHQDFHFVDLGTAGSPLDNIAAQRDATLAGNNLVNGAGTDHIFASYVIPCGFKVTKVGVMASAGTFNVRAANIQDMSTQNCFAEGAAKGVTSASIADTYAGYVSNAEDLGGESAIIPSASLSGGLGNYINIDVIGANTLYGGWIVLERI